ARRQLGGDLHYELPLVTDRLRKLQLHVADTAAGVIEHEEIGAATTDLEQQSVVGQIAATVRESERGVPGVDRAVEESPAHVVVRQLRTERPTAVESVRERQG